MSAFNAKVGIPPGRASEGVYLFDGGRLDPDGTPEVRDRTGPVGFDGGIVSEHASEILVDNEVSNLPRRCFLTMMGV